MDKQILKTKCMDFAIRIVKLCKHLKTEKKEFVLSDQLLRSGTSIGANYNESKNASSRKDFSNKIIIALKEANETEYWLELLYKTDYLLTKEYESIIADCNELVRLLTSSAKTSRTNGEINE